MNKSYYREKQNEWVQENGVTVGDSMMVTRLPGHEGDCYWPRAWAKQMDPAIGRIGEVKEFLNNGIRLHIPEIYYDYVYPYFILEKVGSEQQVSVHKEWEVSYGLKARTGDPVLVRDGDNSE